jgi:hypothetical protein
VTGVLADKISVPAPHATERQAQYGYPVFLVDGKKRKTLPLLVLWAGIMPYCNVNVFSKKPLLKLNWLNIPEEYNETKNYLYLPKMCRPVP